MFFSRLEKEYVYQKFLSVAISVALLVLPGVVLAGGSSYSTDLVGNTVLAQPGTIAKNVQALYVQTYFIPETQYNQIRIESAKVVCWGDNAAQSARLTIGDQVYATGTFKRNSTLGTYEVVLVPKQVTLENYSTYHINLDVVTKKTVSTLVVVCGISEFHIAVGKDGTNFTPDEGYGYQVGQTSGTVVVTNLKKFRYHPLLKNNQLTVNLQKKGVIQGRVSSLGGNVYQLEVYSWDQDFYYGVLPFKETDQVVFDITNPAALPLGTLGHDTASYSIRELHRYSTTSVSGAVGSVIVE